jgi:hypothetical protein
VYLLRVRLARGEGALAKVATLLGSVGVNISRLQTLATNERGAVVDFLLEVADDFLPGVILEELGWLDGVTAEGISTYPAGGGLHYDLQVVERMSRGSVSPAQVLATAAPLLCGARWALVVDGRNLRVLFRTAAAPELRRAELTRLASFTDTPTSELAAEAGSDEERVAVATIPLPPDSVLVIGRPAASPFTPSELARLSYLAAVASGTCSSVPRLGEAARGPARPIDVGHGYVDAMSVANPKPVGMA